MNSKVLYIFRHGQTDWNKQRRLQGHADISLNEEGRRQAQSLQAFFNQKAIDQVFSSDLDRAIETAAIATNRSRPEIITSSGLKEVRLGILEGIFETEFIAQHGDADLARWRSFEDEHRHFTFKGGESRHECNLRLEKALLEICTKNSFQQAAVCTHGFAMRRFFHHISGEKLIPPMIENCVVFEVHFLKEHFLLV